MPSVPPPSPSVPPTPSAPEAPPAAAAAVFGAQLPLAERFAQLLVTDGVVRGVIGPHEPGRIWTRHLLNCAVISDLFVGGERVVDIGSGAGLPGIVLALRRPDLRIDLVEPLLRRVEFLHYLVDTLGIGERVRVVRGRATDLGVVDAVGAARWVTARAVAPLDRLVAWCLPLLSTDGHLALMKGASAEDELVRHRAALRRLGASGARIVHCGVGVVEPAAAVVTLGLALPRPASRQGGRG